MRRFLVMVLLVLVLGGCGSQDDTMQRGISLREALLKCGCSFKTEIAADYGDRIYNFSVGCTADPEGNLKFIVLSPESISGISGKLTATSGFLTFDDVALAFPLLADGEVSPVSAPWLLINTLRSGYLHSAGMDGENIRLTIHDSYEADALQLDIWLDENNLPIYAEILWQGRRVLSMKIKDFAFV